MSTSHLRRPHESHGNHPMSFVAFVLALAGFAMAALWVVHMAEGNTAYGILFAVLMVAAFGSAAAIFTNLAHRHHHSPILPDNTPNETERYLRKYRD